VKVRKIPSVINHGRTWPLTTQLSPPNTYRKSTRGAQRKEGEQQHRISGATRKEVMLEGASYAGHSWKRPDASLAFCPKEPEGGQAQGF